MDLHEYMVKSHRNVFWFWEQNHVLHGIYGSIWAAAREHAVRIVVVPDRITWENADGKTGGFSIKPEYWPIDIVIGFNKIYNRDHIIQQCVHVLKTAEDRIECELIY